MENNNNLPIDDVKMEQEPVQQPAEMTGEYPSYASVTPVKKKSNVLKPVLITSGAVVAAGAVGAVAAFGFGSDIKCAVMGEAKYANSVMDRTVDKFVGETTSAEVASAVVSYAQPMLKTFAVMNKCETEEEQMAYTFASAFEALEESGYSMEFGVQADFGDVVTDIIDEEFEYSFDSSDEIDAMWDIIDYCCNLYIGVDQKMTEDAYACAFRFGSGEAELAKVNFLYEMGGDAYVAFPEASETALMLELPEFPDEEDLDIPEVDAAEIEILINSLTEVIDASFEKAAIEVEDATFKVGSGKFEGNCIEVVYDSDQLGELIVDLAEVIAENDYIVDLVEEITEEEIDMSELTEEAEYMADSLADDGTFELTLRSYVTKSDVVAGTEIIFGNDYTTLTLAALDTDDVFAMEFDCDSESEYDCFTATVDVVKESKTSGVINLEFVQDYNGINVGFDIAYSDLAIVNRFGMDNLCGTFTMEIDEDLFDAMELDLDETVYVGDEEWELGDLVGGIALTFKCSEIDKGLRYDFMLVTEELGTYSIYTSMAEGCGDLPMSYSDSISIDDISEDDGVQLIEDVIEYYIDKLLDTPEFEGFFDILGIADSGDFIDEAFGGDLGAYVEDYVEYYLDY